MVALDKTFAVGEVLSAADVNAHLLGLWSPIDKRVVASGSPVASVSFASIDSTFRLFRLTFHITPVSGGFVIRLNNDSAANYTHQETIGDGATGTFGRLSGDTGFDAFGGTPTLFEGTIGKPSTTTPGRLIGNYAWASTTSLKTGTIAGYWNNTSELINRIDVVQIASGTFHGVVSLEGMRGV